LVITLGQAPGLGLLRCHTLALCPTPLYLDLAMTTPNQTRRTPPVAATSAPLTPERLSALRDLVPEAFGEAGIDWDKLKAALGETVDDRPDRYRFEWAGKRDAIALLQRPSTATLVPVAEESINFDTTRHVFIEGENLEVLKLLYKPYAGRVKMIYIDPPYNTGNDFIYRDDYSRPLQAYLEQTGQAAAAPADARGAAERASRTGRIHSDWLNMMYPRLFLARQLLREDGVIFVSCDDNEVHHLRPLMNELFGEENFVATIIWKKMDSPSRNDENRAFSNYHDYIIAFSRLRERAALRQMAKSQILDAYPIELPDGRPARLRQLRKNGKNARREDRPTMWYGLTAPDGTEVFPIDPDEKWEGRWVLSRETWEERTRAGMTKWVKRSYGWVPYYVEIGPSDPRVPWPTIWGDLDQNRQAVAKFTALMGSELRFDNPKPVNLVMRLLRVASTSDAICLDFFAGSGTTAEAVLRLNREDGGNRSFVLVQFPEPLPSKVVCNGGRVIRTVSESAVERIRRVVNEFKREGPQREIELSSDENPQEQDVGVGVFRLARSQLRPWEVNGESPPAYAEALSLQLDPLSPDAEAADVVHEVALKEAGMSLSARFAKVESITTNTVYRVTDPDDGRQFHICLDDRLHPDTPKALGLKGDADLLVCRDVALDDTLAANLALQCRLRTL
jgi:adenine-specific DNA-methyltransferase